MVKMQTITESPWEFADITHIREKLSYEAVPLPDKRPVNSLTHSVLNFHQFPPEMCRKNQAKSYPLPLKI